MQASARSKHRPIVQSVLFGCGALLAAGVTSTAWGSSHREAPFITEQPKVDSTDLYMFRSYEPGRENFVTLIANYIPFQDPFGGPNYWMFDPDALYQIHIDNNGDAKPDITFSFRFQNTNKDFQLAIGGKQISIPLIQRGQINSVNDANLNVRETYAVQVVRGGAAADITNLSGGSTVFDKPVDYIGMKTLPNYPGYAGQHLYSINLPGCALPGSRMFVGQRKESFVINVGETFDLINIPPAVVTGMENARKNDLENKNITSIALEIPIGCLTNGSEPVIGGWQTASLRQSRVINPAPTSSTTDAAKEGGAFVQVSRLGMPLVNEVVIGLKDKDKFNASKPEGDAQFLDYVTNPFLPELIESQFGAAAPNNFPRNDLVATFLTGIQGLNKPAGVVPSEMMRLNTSIAPKAKGAQNRLGVIGTDTAGFPNGRRPGDDVVDIELRVAMGILCTLNQPAVFGCVPADAPAGSTPFTDGAFTSDQRFDAAFPYLRTPIPGSPQP